ncbi:AraC family transcriptional regulator [Acinetobacter sp. ANC 4648]|uniref:AraC family transcriptional regulator n=1 Tax=Acinetobacter sp. ANC 4648 TaxID=1977875 RepID=UPI000A35565D|nr:AraC family transcriptional regulator [Acinetobacter sp. ANC 4648]OTG83046.1 AraC family transcriptional regulator [Acinetobacter sp. ANC 4648]
MEYAVDQQQLHYSKDTISISLVHEALISAHDKGLNTQQLLQKAGIALELMSSTKTRVSVSAYAQLWIVLADAMNDEFFAMDSHPMRRGSYQLLSKMARHADTLGDAVTQILQFLNLVLDDFESKLLVEENYAYIIIYDRQPTKRMFSYATYLMLIHGLMCWLIGQRVSLKRIQLKCNPPPDDQDYKIRFCDDIQYHADENYMQFDANYLKYPIKQDQKSWYQFIKNTPHNLLIRFKNPNALSAIIRKQLMQVHPSEWLELHTLAMQLNMSEATIQRRLKSEGMSYQQLKNDIRRDTAIEQLTKTKKSLHHISDELNFHDPSAFHRAFKKWTGVSPGAYRQLQDK